jgi:hypothetical protein
VRLMPRRLLVLALAVLGVLLAGTLGYAAYLASRDSVGLPVTRLDQPRQDLAPTRARTRAQPKPKPKPRATTVATTTDDHSGRSRGGGSGSDNSGHGGRGGGDD